MTLLASTKPTRPARPTGWVPFALIALVAIPAVAGSLRLVGLAGGPLLLPANPRMTASPLPVFVHVLSAVPYAVLGAFQFSSRLRRRHPRWHRSTGKLVVALASGRATALSGRFIHVLDDLEEMIDSADSIVARDLQVLRLRVAQLTEMNP